MLLKLDKYSADGMGLLALPFYILPLRKFLICHGDLPSSRILIADVSNDNLELDNFTLQRRNGEAACSPMNVSEFSDTRRTYD